MRFLHLLQDVDEGWKKLIKINAVESLIVVS